ncbi:MAG: hypothetical protein ACYTFA_17770 [Planctomycetota bacterium]|jgi:hypothetical protein
MKATTTKLLTAGVAALALAGAFTLLGAGNAQAKQIPKDLPLWCWQCRSVITTRNTVCELTGCSDGCMYECRVIPHDER